jgi:hypothetical protein
MHVGGADVVIAVRSVRMTGVRVVMRVTRVLFERGLMHAIGEALALMFVVDVIVVVLNSHALTMFTIKPTTAIGIASLKWIGIGDMNRKTAS